LKFPKLLIRREANVTAKLGYKICSLEEHLPCVVRLEGGKLDNVGEDKPNSYIADKTNEKPSNYKLLPLFSFYNELTMRAEIRNGRDLRK